MVKIIETNITLNEDNTVNDFQSRVIEVESWNQFVDEIKNRESVIRSSCLGSLHGATLPRRIQVLDEKCDDRHLSVTFVNSFGVKLTKLAYLISE